MRVEPCLAAACAVFAALAFCGKAAAACHSREVAVVESDPELSHRALVEEVNQLNHDFYPIGEGIHDYASVRHRDKRRLRLDEAVQHVTAQVILREADPAKIRREIDKIYRQIARLHCRKASKNKPSW